MMMERCFQTRVATLAAFLHIDVMNASINPISGGVVIQLCHVLYMHGIVLRLKLLMNGVMACGRQVTTTGGCNSQNYTVQQNYQKVCGRIIGYQIGSTNVFENRQLSIDESYVDGVSVTYGVPRKHIWTFAGGISETIVAAFPTLSCPCAVVGTGVQLQQPPAFVGNNYFCESGNPLNTHESTNVFRYTDDPLWDGEKCEGQCCDNVNYSSPPWFSVTLPVATSEDIEVRICANQATSNEDVAIELLEIYVQ